MHANSFVRELIAKLNRSRFADTVTVMPGCGVSEENLSALLADTGCREFHTSAKSVVESPMRFRNERSCMGAAAVSKDYSLVVSDVERVRKMAQIFKDHMN